MASHHSGTAPVTVCTCDSDRRYPDGRPEFRTLRTWYQLLSVAQLWCHFYACHNTFANAFIQIHGMVYDIAEKQPVTTKSCETA
jgi:hypothetical protein